LESRRVIIQFNILAVKQALIHANAIKGTQLACKTILAVFQMAECPLLAQSGHSTGPTGENLVTAEPVEQDHVRVHPDRGFKSG
jgi:hypothetical protein